LSPLTKTTEEKKTELFSTVDDVFSEAYVTKTQHIYWLHTVSRAYTKTINVTRCHWCILASDAGLF